MFSTRTPRVQTSAGRQNGACPAGHAPFQPHGYGSWMSLMPSVTALTAVAKMGPSSAPLAAQ